MIADTSTYFDLLGNDANSSIMSHAAMWPIVWRARS